MLVAGFKRPAPPARPSVQRIVAGDDGGKRRPQRAPRRDGLTTTRSGEEPVMSYLVQLPHGELTVRSKRRVADVLREYVRDHPADPELAHVAVWRLAAGGNPTDDQLAPREFLDERPQGDQ